MLSRPLPGPRRIPPLARRRASRGGPVRRPRQLEPGAEPAAVPAGCGCGAQRRGPAQDRGCGPAAHGAHRGRHAAAGGGGAVQEGRHGAGRVGGGGRLGLHMLLLRSCWRLPSKQAVPPWGGSEGGSRTVNGVAVSMAWDSWSWPPVAPPAATGALSRESGCMQGRSVHMCALSAGRCTAAGGRASLPTKPSAPASA